MMRGTTPEEDIELGDIEEGTITAVTPYSEVREDGEPAGWGVSYGTGMGVGVRNVGTEPKVGDHLRCFGRFGAEVHGQALNGVVLWYEDPAEQEERRRLMREKSDSERKARFEEHRAELDAAYDALPDRFKARIDRFRAGSESFRWEHESYEMGCCTDAVKLAAWCSEPQNIAKVSEVFHGEELLDPPAMIEAIRNMETRHLALAEAGVGNGHSGNSMGFVFRLAWLELAFPHLVPFEHGALTMITGCEDYGCTHDPDAIAAAEAAGG